MNIFSKITALTVIAVLFVLSCSKTPNDTRLRRREVLYKFTEITEVCTAIWSQGAIKHATPDRLLETLRHSYNKLGYLVVAEGQLKWEMPWPYESIDEPVNIEEKNNMVVISGKTGIIELKFTSWALDNDLAILQTEGFLCQEMPDFVKENVMASCIKNIILSLRDKLE